jgi:hypothetical protein
VPPVTAQIHFKMLPGCSWASTHPPSPYLHACSPFAHPALGSFAFSILQMEITEA